MNGHFSLVSMASNYFYNVFIVLYRIEIELDYGCHNYPETLAGNLLPEDIHDVYGKSEEKKHRRLT